MTSDDSSGTGGNGPFDASEESGVRDASRDVIAELALAVFWVVFGILLIVESSQIQLTSVADPLGPSLVPRLVAVLLVVFGAAIGFDYMRRQRKVAGGQVGSLEQDEESIAEEVTEQRPSSTTRGLMTIAISLGFVALIPLIGYLAATFVGALAIMIHLRESEHPAVLTLLAAALAIGTYWVFTNLLNVQLPTPLLL